MLTWSMAGCAAKNLIGQAVTLFAVLGNLRQRQQCKSRTLMQCLGVGVSERDEMNIL